MAALNDSTENISLLIKQFDLNLDFPW